MVFSRNLSNGKKLYNPGFIKQQHHKEQWFFITAILNIRVLGTHLLASQLQPNTWFSSWPTLAKYCQPAPVTAPSPNTQESIWLVQLCDKALNSICTIPGAGCPTPALLSLPSPKLLKSKLSLAGKCLSDNDCDSNGWHHWNLLWCWHKNTMSHDNATIAVFEKKKNNTLSAEGFWYLQIAMHLFLLFTSLLLERISAHLEGLESSFCSLQKDSAAEIAWNVTGTQSPTPFHLLPYCQILHLSKAYRLQEEKAFFIFMRTQCNV